MHTFKDKKGDEWIVCLDLGIVYAIETSIDFSAVTDVKLRFRQFDEKTATEIVTNIFVAAPIAWACCREQAEQRGITSDTGFYSRLDANAIRGMQLAVAKELMDIFPFYRTIILKLIEQFSKAERIVEEQAQEIGLTDEQMRKLVRKQMNDYKKKVEDLVGDSSSP